MRVRVPNPSEMGYVKGLLTAAEQRHAGLDRIARDAADAASDDTGSYATAGEACDAAEDAYADYARLLRWIWHAEMCPDTPGAIYNVRPGKDPEVVAE